MVDSIEKALHELNLPLHQVGRRGQRADAHELSKEEILAPVGLERPDIDTELSFHEEAIALTIEDAVGREGGVVGNGVADLVSIRADDVSQASMEGVTAVFLFLPPATVSALLPGLLGNLPRGARVIAHEQSPMQIAVAPDRSDPLFAESALTVAHLWTAQER